MVAVMAEESSRAPATTTAPPASTGCTAAAPASPTSCAPFAAAAGARRRRAVYLPPQHRMPCQRQRYDEQNVDKWRWGLHSCLRRLLVVWLSWPQSLPDYIRVCLCVAPAQNHTRCLTVGFRLRSVERRRLKRHFCSLECFIRAYVHITVSRIFTREVSAAIG